uniref:Putative vitellogenin n=1 Tax=Ixodes scapularis TaxID=6945 RepID=A0A4D5S653_IXOSC
MRVLCGLPLLLVAATANALLFELVPTSRGSGSAVYKVNGTVTLKTLELDVTEGPALTYEGDLAVQKLTETDYVAKFLNFTLVKFDKVLGDVHHFEPHYESSLFGQEVDYFQYVQYPVWFSLKQGKVVEFGVAQEVREGALNVYKAVLTLLQSQPETFQELPAVVSYYEDGVSGYCRVNYELQSLDAHVYTGVNVLNVTKTKYLDDCKKTRPVYTVDSVEVQGYPPLCNKHLPNNFLPGYQEDTAEYEASPTVGCPVGYKPFDTLVTAHEVSYYNLSDNVLESAYTESLDVLNVFTGKVVVKTLLKVWLAHVDGPQLEEFTPVQTYQTLELVLPETAHYFDLPVYSLLVETPEEVSVEVFQRALTTVVDELVSLEVEDETVEPKQTPGLLLQLVKTVAVLNLEQLKQTVPEFLQRPVLELAPHEQVHRSLWVDLIGKAGTKSSLDLVLYLLQQNLLTRNEAARVLQDVAAFKAYPEKETIEKFLEFALGQSQVLPPLVFSTLLHTLGELVNEACPSEVEYPSYEEGYLVEVEQHAPLHRLYLPVGAQCTVQDLKQYVLTISEALKQTDDFKKVVAYLHGLGKFAKPEVLPVLLAYVNGTAENLYRLVSQDEDYLESVYFVKKAALLALDHVVKYYPKEVSPLVRTLVLNTTEPTDLRTLAFDIWLKTVPAKWDLQQVVLAAKTDLSLEFGTYVYTALKSIVKDKRPVNSLLASRVRGVFTHLKPHDFGLRFAHLYKHTYYNAEHLFGLESLFKKVATNTSFFPSYLSHGIKYNLGPYFKTLLSGKLLLKGGEKVLDDVFGHDGLLTKVVLALQGELDTSPRHFEHHTRETSLFKELNVEPRKVETPKAVLLWQFLTGEAVLPVDEELFHELQKELLELVHKVGQEGLTYHFVRLVLPKQLYHVEPSPVGLPVVHTIQHPVLLSLKLDKLALSLQTAPGSLLPVSAKFTGTVHPSLFTTNQVRVFVSDLVGTPSPTVVLTDTKELNFKHTVEVEYSKEDAQQLQVSVKPHYGRVFLSAKCTEHVLTTNKIFEPLTTPFLEYSKCIKSMAVPYTYEKTYGGEFLNVDVSAVSHQPWSKPPLYKVLPEGTTRLDALLQWISSKTYKHTVLSVDVKPYAADPVTEWTATFKYQNNLKELVEATLHQEEGLYPEVNAAKEASWFARVNPFHGKKHHHEQEHHEEEEHHWEFPAQYVEAIEDYEEISGMPILSKVRKAHHTHHHTRHHTHHKSHHKTPKTHRTQYKWTVPTFLNKTHTKHALTVTLEGKDGGAVKKGVQLNYVGLRTLDKSSRKLYLDVETTFLPKLSLFLNVTHPVVPSPFYYVPSFLGKDVANATLYIRYGDDLTKPIVVTYNATKTEEQVLGVHGYDGAPLLKWFVPQCLEDQHNGFAVSYACRLATTFDAHLNHQVVHVKVPQHFAEDLVLKKYAFKSLNYLKYKLFPYVTFQALPHLTHQVEPEFTLYFNKSQVNPFVTVGSGVVVLPGEKLTVKNLKVSEFYSPNLLLSGYDRFLHSHYNGFPYLPCGVGKNYLRTYDNVSYPLELKDECKYLLTGDCTTRSDFSVVLEPLDLEVGTKKLTLQLFDTVVVLPPPDLYKAEVVLTVNGTTYVATEYKDVVLPYKAYHKLFITVYPTSGPHDPPVVQLTNTLRTFKVVFDGVNAYVWVHPLYQSKTCGLCGNYDNEPAFEFFTPTNELVSNYSEFVASYGFGGAQCHEVVPSVLSTLSQLQVLKGAFLATWAARPAHLGRSWFNVMGHHQHHHHELPEENSDEVKDGVLPWFHPEHLLPHHKYPQHHKTTPYPYATPFTPRYHHHSTQYHYATPFTPRHHEHSKHHHYATPEYYESEEYRRATPFTPRHYGSTKYNYAATPFTPRHYESEEELRATPFTPRYHHYKATPFTPRYHHQAKKFTPLYYESEEDLRATPFTPRYHHYKATPFTPRYHHATPFTPRHYESEEELRATPFTPRYHHYKATPFTPRYHHATPFTPRHYESEEELGATPFTPRYHHYKATPFTPRYHHATPFTPRHYESEEELGATPFTPRYHHSTPYPYATPFTPRHHHTKQHHYATPYTPRYPSEDLQRSEILEELKPGQMMKQYYEDTEESKCFQERTIMRDHEGMICYSQVPVPSCKPGCKKGKGSVQLSVPFVCLDRSSPMAKELTKKVRKLGNVGKLPIDLETTPHVEQVRVPEKCVPYEK